MWLAVREDRPQPPDSRGDTKEAQRQTKQPYQLGWGGETEWDAPKVGCGNLISKENEAI